MTYKITDEYQKVLAEMIDEDSQLEPCKRCKPTHYELKQRTFTTDADMMKVFRWLVDNGKWEKFLMWATNKYWAEDNDNGFTFLPWLFYDSERFCFLAAEAKKENIV